MERLLDAATAHDRLLHCLDDPRLNQIRYATTVAMIHGERRISVKLTYLDGTDAPAEARTCMVHSLTRAEKRMWAGDATYRKALRESPLSATRTFTVFPVGLAYDWLTGSACAIRSECLRPAGLGTVCYEADVEPSQLRDRLFWRLRITNKKLPRETMWRFKVTTRACEADFSYAPSPRHHPVDVKKVERCMNQVLNTFAAKAARVRFYTPDWILLTSGLRRVPFCNFWNEHILPPDHE
jgi:hypothetical protein